MTLISNKTMKAFTLIELLVVIAIIGILASVVVLNLNTARGKGQDTATKEQLAQIRNAAGLYFDDNGNYGTAITDGTCPTTAATSSALASASVIKAFAGISRSAGGAATCYISTAGAGFSVTAPIRTGGFWCVDSDGASNAVAAVSTSATCAAS